MKDIYILDNDETIFNDLTSDAYETAHGGYDPTYANEDADRVLPVDVLRDLEKEGKIGELYPYFFFLQASPPVQKTGRNWKCQHFMGTGRLASTQEPPW